LSICPTVSGLILLRVLNTFCIALNWGFASFCSCNKGVIKASVLIVLFLVFPLGLEVNGGFGIPLPFKVLFSSVVLPPPSGTKLPPPILLSIGSFGSIGLPSIE